MKNLPGSRTLFILALSLVLLVNAFILIGVWYNRSGDPESTVVITEREVRMPYSWNKDQTSLHIDWRIVSSEGDSYNSYNSPAWFDQEKLVSLGFEFFDNYDSNINTHFIEAEAILVLEYDGDAYQKAVKIAQDRVGKVERKLAQLVGGDELKTELEIELQADLKDAQETLKHEELSASRLFVIDAGLDEETLRAQYPDNQRFILTYGIVNVGSYGSYGNNVKSDIHGRIYRLSVEKLHIGNTVSSIIDKFDQNGQYSRNVNLPRFSLGVHYGQKLEPWIEQFSLLDVE